MEVAAVNRDLKEEEVTLSLLEKSQGHVVSRDGAHDPPDKKKEIKVDDVLDSVFQNEATLSHRTRDENLCAWQQIDTSKKNSLSNSLDQSMSRTAYPAGNFISALPQTPFSTNEPIRRSVALANGVTVLQPATTNRRYKQAIK